MPQVTVPTSTPPHPASLKNKTSSRATRRGGATLSLFAPGIRYGFMTRTKKLFEVGVSFPIGLNHATPRGGIIVQIQFEHLFGFQGE